MRKPALTPEALAGAKRHSVMVDDERAALLRAVRAAPTVDGRLRVVEIGVKRAGTSLLLLSELDAMGREADLYGVDVASSAKNWWGRRMPSKAGVVRTKFLHAKGFKAADHFAQDSVSLVFLDGCHCYDCVFAEISAWRLCVRVGGFMVFHDTLPRLQAKPGRSKTHDERTGYGILEAIGAFTDGRYALVEDIPGRSGLRVYSRSW